jgi:VWFA-related protein
MWAIARSTGSLLWCLALAAQPPAGEVVTRDTPATFRTKVNLVLVPVVVRNSRGVAIGTLQKDDFQLFDKGKAQFISKFSVEKSGRKPVVVIEDTSGAKLEQQPPGAKLPPAIADRFTAYVFDDVHLKFGDLAQSRVAAAKHLGTSLRVTDRAAIYTSSGRTTLDFTDDREELELTLNRIQPYMSQKMGSDCPPITFYMADLIQNKNDPMALNAATRDAMVCMNLDNTQRSTAEAAAQSGAMRALNVGEQEARFSLGILRNTVRRLTAMPGQRFLVLVSPGFIIPNLHTEVTEVIDSAIRAGVVISTMDARGLYTTGTVMDASQRSLDMQTSTIKLQYEREAASADSDILAELAYGTSGTYFHNSNDLNEGFKLTAAAPEYVYLLGFSPMNLKPNGTFHALKVTAKGQKGITLQARRGFYAPKHIENAAEEAKREMEEALFSREPMRDIPVELHTQFFKSGQFDAKLAVVARVDVRKLQYRKADGRNLDNLTLVCGLFDRNGNYIKGVEKKIEMKLLDGTLETKLAGGILIRNVFDVKTGGYVIRLVVRDTEGQQMAAQNGSIEIP